MSKPTATLTNSNTLYSGIFILIIGLMGCVHQPEPDHYFLDGYPDLIFRTQDGNPVPTRFFITNQSDNGSNTYEVLDQSLMLTYRKDGSAYSGYIRTFHWGIYNIEAIFKDGYIQRLRYWHPNRTLGMDANFLEQSGIVWNSDGSRSIAWNADQHVHYNPSTQKPREIQEDSITTYFTISGEMDYYTIREDSMSRSYYPDGTPSYFRPRGASGTGPVKRWYPNGQLRAEGQFRNWDEAGIWIEYDSLGTEINRINYDLEP